MLEAEDQLGLPGVDQLSPDHARAASEVGIAELWGRLEPVAAVRDLLIDTGAGKLKARLYRPGGALGTVLFLHGGGWVVGSLDTHDGPCRRLANAVPCDVLSVEYRKAPEHPFPAAIDDADGCLGWLIEHGAGIGVDTSRIIVAGESAGANLAAVLVRHARDRNIALAGQVLITPPTDAAMKTDSYRAFTTGFRLTAASMAWFANQYIPGHVSRSDPDVSPLRAPDLTRLPPALVVPPSSIRCATRAGPMPPA